MSSVRVAPVGGVQFELRPRSRRQALRGVPLPETPAEDKGAAHVTFLLNFFDELRRKVPVGK